MKIKKAIWCVFLLIALSLFDIACSGISASERAEINSIKKSFDTLSQAMVDGKLEIAYNLLCATYKFTETYEQFVKEYNEGRDTLVMRYKGSYLSNISVNGNQATARLFFGTGEKIMLNFIKEGDVWKVESRSEKTIP